MTTLRQAGAQLRPRDLHAQLFRQALANLGRKPIMYAPRTLFGGIQNRHWSRRGDCHCQPNQSRQSEACQRGNFEPERMGGPEVADYAEGQQEDAAGNGSESDQPNVNDAVDLLPAAATFAGCEVAFVITAHLWRQAGNVVSPARQNFSHNRVNTLLTHKILRTESPDLSSQSSGFQNPRLSKISAGTKRHGPKLTTELPAEVLTGSQPALGFETAHLVRPALFPLLSLLSLGDYSALRDAPAPQKLHYYHSRR